MNSLFDGRYWAGSESNVLPGCYALNTFLRPEETFLKLICRTDPVRFAGLRRDIWTGVLWGLHCVCACGGDLIPLR